MLRLDHLILRAADPAATLAELSAAAGAPVLAEVEEVGGIASGIVRAGPVDIEVVRIGRDAPPRARGYGIGFVADEPLSDAVAQLRELGFATSPAAAGVAGDRRWRAVQIRGLLPDPFPAPASGRRPGAADRFAEVAAGALSRVPFVARAATRKAGSSMAVLTEYGFDAAAWRARAGEGPAVLEVDVSAGNHRGAWPRLPLAGDGPALHVHDDGRIGITRIVLAGDGGPFSIGDVAFERRAPQSPSA